MTETISEDYLSQLKSAIIDLYLDVKIRSTDEVARLLPSAHILPSRVDRCVLGGQVRKRARAAGRRRQLHHRGLHKELDRDPNEPKNGGARDREERTAPRQDTLKLQ